jgi:hypothetical protein
MRFAGTQATSAGMAQVLVQEFDGTPRCVEASGGRFICGPVMLGGGLFLKSPAGIQMWGPEFDCLSWTYLTSGLAVGSTFSAEIVPCLAFGIMLRGTVVANDASVSTPAGIFSGVVDVAYLADFGIQEATDENGVPLGSYRSEIRGHVYYAPNVGPVKMVQEALPYAWIDCSTYPCPAEWLANAGVVVETQTMALVSASTAAPFPQSVGDDGLRLDSCYPNPFNPRTTIRFELPAIGPVRLLVFDVAGHLVRTLADESMPQGSHEAVWDGRDASGREVGSGSYLARLEFGGKVETVRMGLIR